MWSLKAKSPKNVQFNNYKIHHIKAQELKTAADIDLSSAHGFRLLSAIAMQDVTSMCVSVSVSVHEDAQAKSKIPLPKKMPNLNMPWWTILFFFWTTLSGRCVIILPPPPPLALPPSMILSFFNKAKKPALGESPFLKGSTHVTHISSRSGIMFKIRRDFLLLRNLSEALGSDDDGHPIGLLAPD